VFHKLGQAQFANVGFDFERQPIFVTAPATSKNDAHFKSALN
jgi:hypothetical protein